MLPNNDLRILTRFCQNHSNKIALLTSLLLRRDLFLHSGPCRSLRPRPRAGEQMKMCFAPCECRPRIISRVCVNVAENLSFSSQSCSVIEFSACHQMMMFSSHSLVNQLRGFVRNGGENAVKGALGAVELRFREMCYRGGSSHCWWTTRA